MKARLFSDGGARGNPGPAGIGFCLENDADLLASGGWYIGETTNNVAEYKALIWGLQNALHLAVDEIEIFADSELLVKQLNGEYRVKNQTLKMLYTQACELLRSFASTRVTHVFREHNKVADRLANEAMDRKGPVGSYVADFSDGTLF